MQSPVTLFRFLFAHLFVLLLLAFAQNASAQAQNKKLTDSIFAVIKAMPDDTNKAIYVNKMYDSTLWQYNLPEAYNQLKLAARIANRFGNDTLEFRTYRAMAGYCVRANAHDYALQNNQHALRIAERLNDSVRIASCWTGMAMSFSGLKQNELAIAYYKKALPLVPEAKIERIGRIHTFMGWAYQDMGKIDSAIMFCEAGRVERARAKYGEGVLATNGSLLVMYIQVGRYDKAREIIEESIYIHDTLGHENARLGYGLWFGSIHEKEGNLDSALWYYRTSARHAEQTGNVNFKKESYFKLSALLAETGHEAEAYGYYREYVRINDSIRDWETKNNLERAREIYDVESKNKEIERLQQETALQQMEGEEKDRQRNWLTVVLAVTALLVIIALIAYRQKRKSAILLHDQKQIIEEKNRDITDSIVYAKRIQEAILPSVKEINRAIPESFVLYKAKDIVSGDFFWFSETPSSYYLAVVDCTGHGVPGALMSMIGFNFLGQIVNEKNIIEPKEILNELHRKVLLALNKDYTSHEIKDGMDVALIRIDKKTKAVSFSGAVRPVYLVQDGELDTIKGDIFSIGGIKDVHAESFTQHEIVLKPGSTLYIFSDGFADQFGGPQGKKFKYKQLREILVKNSSLPMSEQHDALEKTFSAWRGNLEQVDDVCLIGVRVTG